MYDMLNVLLAECWLTTVSTLTVEASKASKAVGKNKKVENSRAPNLAATKNTMQAVGTNLTISETAVAKIADILAEENNPLLKLRVFVQGGGCSGFQYGFTLDQSQNEDDFAIDQSGIAILVDAMSMQYLIGAEIDYKESLMSSEFVINNPNAQSTCGCGSSFSV